MRNGFCQQLSVKKYESQRLSYCFPEKAIDIFPTLEEYTGASHNHQHSSGTAIGQHDEQEIGFQRDNLLVYTGKKQRAENGGALYSYGTPEGLFNIFQRHVDEIDLHLHPKWQRTIIRYLTETFKNPQFIVTAHSPLVVQAMPEDANIVLLKREGNQVVIHNSQEQKAIYGWRLDQLVTSDLFDLPSARPPQFDELLRQREEILAKNHLSPEDEKTLERIGQQLSTLPIVGTKEEHEAMSLIRQASELLKVQAG